MATKPTVLTLIEEQVARQPDAIALTWLHNGETPAATLTYRQVVQQAQGIAGHLLDQGLLPGERVLLVYVEGLAFLPAFLGCLYADLVAVPAPMPDSLRGKRLLHHLQAVAVDAQARVALTTREFQAQLPLSPALPVIVTDELPICTTTIAHRTVVGSAQLAYLQYTSGSTGAPKGVMVSHTNLLANLSALHQAWGYTADSAVLTWMPHTHDYGLVEGLLRPLSAGVPCTIMSPWSFLRRPLRWLTAISRLHITHSGGATFAYEHCLRQLNSEPVAELDLRHWQVAVVGGEPIQATMLENFAVAFASYGFARDAFCPGYGLAEATLLTTAKARDRALITRSVTIDGQTTVLTGCGQLWGENQLLVVDSTTLRPLPDGEIGELWVAGPSVAQGYWQQPQATDATFGAELEGQRYLRTGDLGLIDQGTLLICGRLKDLIMIHGQNYHPQDLEWAIAEAHPLLKNGSKAAFAMTTLSTGQPNEAFVEQSAEDLAIVCEVDPQAAKTVDLTEVVQAIRKQVANDFSLPVHHIALVRRGLLPKTPSGKIQRLACRTAWLRSELNPLFTWQLEPCSHLVPDLIPANEPIATRMSSVQMLIGLWRELLGVATIGLHDNFFTLGGDSLTAMHLTMRVEQIYHYQLPVAFFNEPTIANLAKLLSITIQEEPIHLDDAARVTCDHVAKPAQPQSQPQPQRSFMNYVIRRGPHWHKYGLPYGMGVRLQRHWLRLPIIRHALQSELALLQTWLPLLDGQAAVAQLQELSLQANTWHIWRARKMRHPQTCARWASVTGIEHLTQALSTGRPLLLVAFHTPYRNVAVQQVLRRHSQRQSWTLIYSQDDQASAVAKVLKARELLLQGGIVFIAGDGAQGNSGVKASLCGQPWIFRSGGAELALETDAIMLPVFNMLEQTGRMRVTFFDPLATAAQRRSAQVDDLTRQYATLLQTHWPSILPCMSWKKLQQIRTYAQIESEQ